MSESVEKSYLHMQKNSSKKSNEFNLYREIFNSHIVGQKPDVFQMFLDFDKPTNIFRPFILDKRLENETIFKELYKESLICYKKILKIYKELAIDLKITDSLQLSQFLSLLLWGGFFSITGSHSYKLKDRLFLDGMFSFDVFNGSGVCVAYAQLLEDYLREFGFETASIGCKENRKFTTSFTYIPPVKRKYDVSEIDSLIDVLSPDFMSFLCGNKCKHAVTLINDIRGMYIYDMTNLYALNILSSSKASGITCNNSMDIYPEISEFFLSNIDSFDLLERLSFSTDNEVGNQRRVITSPEFISLFNEVIAKFYRKIKNIQDAYSENYADICSISEEIKKYGNYSSSLQAYKKIKKTTR